MSEPGRIAQGEVTIFISHAGGNRAEAGEVSDLLQASGLSVRLDVTEVRPGTDFVAFMESALADSDYCLLLWSHAADASKWVALEWEAALHRAVTDSSGFLIVGRLEDLDLPMLLRPRLSVDLYPRIEPGVSRVISMLRSDTAAAEKTNRHVAKPHADVEDDPDGVRIYVTSKLFGRTFPMRIRLNTPAVAATERLVTMLGLPREISGERGVGLRFEYALATNAGVLAETVSLEQQGVAENSVLWLETAVAAFSGIEPIRKTEGRAIYRSELATAATPDPSSVFWLRARDTLRSRITALGLD